MKTTSIWIDQQTAKNYPTLTHDTTVNTLIIGGGIVGLTTAYYLSKATQDVILVESDRIGYGASGRNTGKITYQHGLIYKDLWKQHGKDGAFAYYKAQQEAIDSIEEIIRDHQIDCDFERCDALLYTQDDTRIADFKDEYQTYLDLEIPCTYVEQADVPFSFCAGIKVDNQAKYDPYRYVLGLSDILDKEAIKIYENSPVKHVIHEENGSYRVIINNLCIHAKNVVMATQFPILDHRHFYFARLYPKVSHIAALTPTQSFGKTVTMRDESPLVSYSEMSLHDTTYLLCGGNQHQSGKENAEEHEVWTNQLLERWQVSKLSYRWSTQDYLSFDHFPLIGPLDYAQDHLYFASGMQKWGNSNGNVAAKLLSAYVLHQESQYAKWFDPHRSNSYLTPKFLQLNLHVMKEFFSSHFPLYNDQYPQIGKANIVRLHDHSYGMYRDEQDDVYLVDITCPHAGCICSFNEVDKTWDCPCHGSRFSVRGDIIKGPATNGLSAYGDGLNPIDPHIFK